MAMAYETEDNQGVMRWHGFIYNLLFIIIGGFTADMGAGYWVINKYEEWVARKGNHEKRER